MIFTLTPQKCQMMLLCDKIDLLVVPNKGKFVQLISHIDGNMQCDKKSSV